MANKDLTIQEPRVAVAQQAQQIEALTAEAKSLKLKLAKAQKDSSTSSKSPSSDIVNPLKKKPAGGKKQNWGGQK